MFRFVARNPLWAMVFVLLCIGASASEPEFHRSPPWRHLDPLDPIHQTICDAGADEMLCAVDRMLACRFSGSTQVCATAAADLRWVHDHARESDRNDRLRQVYRYRALSISVVTDVDKFRQEILAGYRGEFEIARKILPGDLDILIRVKACWLRGLRVVCNNPGSYYHEHHLVRRSDNRWIVGAWFTADELAPVDPDQELVDDPWPD